MRRGKVVLDTSVVIEYVDESGEYHEQARAVFNAILQGGLKAMMPHTILAGSTTT